jgi:hypothetical protein
VTYRTEPLKYDPVYISSSYYYFLPWKNELIFPGGREEFGKDKNKSSTCLSHMVFKDFLYLMHKVFRETVS